MTTTNDFSNLPVDIVTATIAIGQTKSDIINMNGATLKTIFMPAAFTGATIEFEVSYDGVTFAPYANVDDNLVEITITAGRAYGLAAIDFFGVLSFKIVSKSAEAAERSIILVPTGI